MLSRVVKFAVFTNQPATLARIAIVAALAAAVLLAYQASAAGRAGNVFLQGDEVTLKVPDAWAGWRAVDIDGQELATSPSSTEARLGKLPVGYYELLQQDGPGRITAGVVAPNSPAPDTPIALDAAISWFYADPQQIRDACTLCRLAGVEWVRDRLSWPELETDSGAWAGDTRYEHAMRIQHEAGLKILQVNHISPPWATDNPSHFPSDLKLVYDFYRGLALRWKGLVDAIEPWNEPDLELFGGHTGCEIASFQKAAYLGIKAGDSDLPACQSVFAIDRSETLDEFAANEPQPYFDTYNLHHYTGLPAYPRVYGRHRSLSGGKPLWTTEFNLTINWSDPETKEPSDEDLRVQGYRVAKVFSCALHEGCERAFYFILGDYVERTLQYGLVHKDLTPRPAYIAMAAVGRLLNGASALGQVDFGDEKLKAYLFQSLVDGAPQETLVAWSETFETDVKIPGALRLYDYLGRELSPRQQVRLTRAPIFAVLNRGGSKQFKASAPPPKSKPAAKKPSTDARPCPVVLQLLGNPDEQKSAFVLQDQDELQLAAYNFGPNPVRGTLTFEGAESKPDQLSLQPGERSERAIKVTVPGRVTIRLALDNGEQSIVAANVARPAAEPNED